MAAAKRFSSNFFRKPTSLKLIKSSPRQNPFRFPAVLCITGVLLHKPGGFRKGSKVWSKQQAQQLETIWGTKLQSTGAPSPHLSSTTLRYAEFSTHFEPKTKVKKYLVNLFPNIRTDKRWWRRWKVGLRKVAKKKVCPVKVGSNFGEKKGYNLGIWHFCFENLSFICFGNGLK